MNPLWNVYKSKVMKTLNPDMEEDAVEEVNPLKPENNTKQLIGSDVGEHVLEKILRPKFKVYVNLNCIQHFHSFELQSFKRKSA